MGTILIVEDDTQVSTALGKLLIGCGFRVRLETNGAAALLAAHEDAPALIIIDLLAPILDGQETIRALRRHPRTATIPVVAVSAQDKDEQMAHALACGANLYLAIPPDPQELLAGIERLLSLHAQDPSTP